MLEQPPTALTSRPAGTGGGRPRRRSLLAGLLVAVLLVSACSGSDDDAAPPGTTGAPLEEATPPPTAPMATLPMPEGFVAPDTRGVAIAPVESDERPGPSPAENVLPVRGGKATVRVRVDGPPDRAEGPLVVRFERLDGRLRGWEDVPADGGGVATLTEAMGGRYRVRAWRRPDLSATESQTTFVGFDQTVELRVRVERHDAVVLQGALTAGRWTVGDVVGLQVLALREEVDGEGIVRGRPEAVEVQVRQFAGAAVDGESSVSTDPASGYATIPVRCDAAGEHRLQLVGGGSEVEVALPACLPRPAPTTTTTTEPDRATTTTTSGATTTTRRRAGPTTTRAGGERPG